MTRTVIPLPPPLVVSRARLQQLEDAARLEWLEADGRGGFAAGSAAGANTRREHGLVVAARRSPSDRVVLLSRLEETLVLDGGERFELATNFYPDTVHPRGHLLLDAFALDPWPMWRYSAGGVDLIKEIFVSRRAGATVLRYQLRGAQARLELRPLVAGRELHELCTANDRIDASVESSEGLVAHRSYDSFPPVVLSFENGDWESGGDWYYRTVYPRDAELGLPAREDLFCPGVLRVPLLTAQPTVIACGVRPARVANAGQWVSDELRRRGRAADAGRLAAGDQPGLADLGARLALAADAFLTERDGACAMVAGYPSHGERTRDAMIALAALAPLTGRTSDLAGVLRTIAVHLEDGLLPDRFPDDGPPQNDAYAEVDTPLWFIEAVAMLRAAGGEVDEFWPAVKEVLRAYEHGTHFGIRLDRDGLLSHGAAGRTLGRMPTAVTESAQTSRRGKAVDVNALWYNALCRAASLARSRTRAQRCNGMAARCRDAFASFWYDEGGYLYDSIDPEGPPDATLRPNQLLALSLPHSPLSAAQASRVLDAVERELVTPLGVRTLAPGDARYDGTLAAARREATRLSGAAWPWLLGHFAAAWLRVHGDAHDARQRLHRMLDPLERHLEAYGLGHLAEVCAGDPPHPPAGCFAQATSCAEMLRIVQLLGRSLSD